MSCRLKSSVVAPLLACQRQPLGDRVDGDDPLGAEEESAFDGELADRPAAPDGNRVAWSDIAEVAAM